jgi:hypothetical protein
MRAALQIYYYHSGGGSQAPTSPTQSESTAFFARFPLLTAAEQRDVNTYIYYLKNTLTPSGLQSYWDSRDIICLRFLSDKNASLANIKSADFGNATISNGDYVGSHIPGVGFKGSDVSSFRMLTNYNPGNAARTYKFVATQGSYGILFATDEANENAYDMWGVDPAASSNGMFIRPRRNLTNHYLAEKYPGAALIANWVTPYCYGPYDHVRTTGNVHRDYFNGLLTWDQTNASTSLVNTEWKEFHFFTNGAGNGGYSNKVHAAIHAGDGDFNPSIFWGLFYKAFKYEADPQINFGRRVLMIGDGRTCGTSDVNLDLGALSVHGEVIRRTVQQLNGGDHVYTGWNGMAVGIPNRTLAQMNTDKAKVSIQARCSDLEKDIVVLWGGTSDVEFNAAETVAGLYARHQEWELAHRTAGFTKVIQIGPCGIGFASYPSGRTTAEVTQFEIDVNNLMLAEHNIPTGITRVTTNAQGSYYCNLLADTRLTDYNDLTYFHADKAHLNETGSRVLADEYIVPICQL